MELNFPQIPTTVRLSKIYPFQQALVSVPAVLSKILHISFDRDKALFFYPAMKSAIVARSDSSRNLHLLPLQDEHPDILPRMPFHTIKYVGKHHPDHLLNILKNNYEGVHEDWPGVNNCGITLKWDYIARMCELSMPGYIKAILI